MKSVEMRLEYEKLKKMRRKLGELKYLEKLAELYVKDKQSTLFPEPIEWIREQRGLNVRRWL